jgi:hypothetical protein
MSSHRFADVLLVIMDLVGLAAVAYGCWLAWRPLGFIVPGAVVLTLSILADLRQDTAAQSRGSGAAPALLRRASDIVTPEAK